jgi:hypothetical protein
MKVRITQAGWAGFNGQLGEIQFEDGVSVTDMNDWQVQRIGAIVSIENVETELQVGPSVDVLNGWGSDVDKAIAAAPNADEVKDSNTTRGADVHAYTEEELGKIADAHGIKGIREIADQYGLKGTSIKKLMTGILGEQSKGRRVAIETVVTVEAVAEKIAGEAKERIAKDSPDKQ